jgi:endo-1,4-beta-xylanase
MLSFTSIVVRVLAAVATIAQAAPQPALEARQNNNNFNSIQNWANDFADVEFRNNAGGNFNVTWDNGPGGNFVVGKGYRPARDM